GRRVYDGPMGKSDRAAFIGALALLTLAAPQVISVWPWIFTLAALLTLLTCWNRLSHALRGNNVESTSQEAAMNHRRTVDALRRPLPSYSLKSAYYASVRTLLKTVGNLSDGIRLGNRHGFDSGVMLDYVYKNQAGGRLLIGRLMDRIYLNAIGWRGIRLRRRLGIQSLKKWVARQRAGHTGDRDIGP